MTSAALVAALLLAAPTGLAALGDAQPADERPDDSSADSSGDRLSAGPLRAWSTTRETGPVHHAHLEARSQASPDGVPVVLDVDVGANATTGNDTLDAFLDQATPGVRAPVGGASLDAHLATGADVPGDG